MQGNCAHMHHPQYTGLLLALFGEGVVHWPTAFLRLARVVRIGMPIVCTCKSRNPEAFPFTCRLTSDLRLLPLCRHKTVSESAQRTDIVSAAQRYWTRLWWDEVRSRYEVVVSRAVVDELSSPDFPHSEEALELIRGVPLVPVVEDARQIVLAYIRNHVMPANPVGDALHLALASHHKCDYLLTWNCKHIANPNKFRQIRLCNTSMGLYVPFLVTPNQLIGG